MFEGAEGAAAMEREHLAAEAKRRWAAGDIEGSHAAWDAYEDVRVISPTYPRW